MSAESVLIVGGGPAGLSCGIRLLRTDPSREVTVLEKEPAPGGISGGFERNGLSYDYGSHRIHPSIDQPTLGFLSGLPHLTLVKRRRNGRILLEGRLVRFPPSPLDALIGLPPKLSAGILRDQLSGLAKRRSLSAPRSFSEAVEAGMGRSMAEAFYIPYTKKLWGLDASEISSVQASRRVSAAGRGGLLKKVLGGLPLVSKLDPSRFFRYPEGGFAALASALSGEFERLGGRLSTSSEVTGIGWDGRSASVSTSDGSRWSGGHVIWSAPLDALAAAARTSVPEDVVRSAAGLGYRAMVLLYVQLEEGPYTPYDAHYFPGADTRFSRMSEPRNYPRAAGRGRTGLCLELPCAISGGEMTADPGALLRGLLMDLERSPMPAPGPVSEVWSRKLTHAYPVYRLGFEERLEAVQRWALSSSWLTLVGRQGLFAHDNVHHAIATGIAAADCLRGTARDTEAWARHLEAFRSHCVSD
jgi:protoporphyrinogen oxidase